MDNLDGRLKDLKAEKIGLMSEVPESEKWYANFVWIRRFEDYRVLSDEYKIRGYELANEDLRKHVDDLKKNRNIIIPW